MTLTFEISTETFERLQREATARGMSVQQIAAERLTDSLERSEATPANPPVDSAFDDVARGVVRDSDELLRRLS